MQSRKVFLAPDIFVAFVDRGHPKHLHATAFFRYFSQEQHFLYTNPESIMDAYTLIQKKISPFLAKDFMKAISLGSINMLYPEDTDLRLAYKTLLSSSSQDISMQEILMAVMSERRSIPQICTFEYLHPLFGLTTFFLPL